MDSLIPSNVYACLHHSPALICLASPRTVNHPVKVKNNRTSHPWHPKCFRQKLEHSTSASTTSNKEIPPSLFQSLSMPRRTGFALQVGHAVWGSQKVSICVNQALSALKQQRLLGTVLSSPNRTIHIQYNYTIWLYYTILTEIGSELYWCTSLQHLLHSPCSTWEPMQRRRSETPLLQHWPGDTS